MAKNKKLARGVVCEIELPEKATLETGGRREDETDDRLKVEWVVRAPKGAVIRLIARHERAGTAIASITLDQG